MIIKNQFINKIVLVVLTVLISATFVQAAEVIIENDLEKQTEGTKLEVDHIKIRNLPKLKFQLTLYPGDSKVIAAGSVTRFTLSRVFPTHKIKYDVSCIKSERSIELTLEKIHNNNMEDVCTLKKFGHWSKRSGLKWTNL